MLLQVRIPNKSKPNPQTRGTKRADPKTHPTERPGHQKKPFWCSSDLFGPVFLRRFCVHSVAVDMDNTNVFPPVHKIGDLQYPRWYVLVLSLPSPKSWSTTTDQKQNSTCHPPSMKTFHPTRINPGPLPRDLGEWFFFYRGRRRRLYKHQRKGTRVGGRGGERAGRLHPDQRRYTGSTIAVCKTRPNTCAHHHRSFSRLFPGLTLWWFRPTKSEKRGGNEEGTAYMYL